MVKMTESDRSRVRKVQKCGILIKDNTPSKGIFFVPESQSKARQSKVVPITRVKAKQSKQSKSKVKAK